MSDRGVSTRMPHTDKGAHSVETLDISNPLLYQENSTALMQAATSCHTMEKTGDTSLPCWNILKHVTPGYFSAVLFS